jgi:hypothetical protein
MRVWRQFDQMRGDHDRTWHRRSDIVAALAAEGLPMTWWEASKVLATLPRPEKRYGHFRYTAEHRDAVLAAARCAYKCEEVTT